MTPGDGAEDRDEAQHEQYPMKSLKPREGTLRSAPSAGLERAIEARGSMMNSISVNTSHTATIASSHQYSIVKNADHKFIRYII